MLIGTLLTTLLLMLDEIALMVDRLRLPADRGVARPGEASTDIAAAAAPHGTETDSQRETRILWAVFKGSALNKAIVVPAALAITVLAPWLIPPLLMIGGLYLCYEGAQKLAPTSWRHGNRGAGDDEPGHPDAAADDRARIRSALRTDFVLSGEIIVISLGGILEESLLSQFIILATVAAIATFGVYGITGAILRLDDAGRYLLQRSGKGGATAFLRPIGQALIAGAPSITKGTVILGTAAAFFIGGGLLTAGIPGMTSAVEAAVGQVGGSIAAGEAALWIGEALLETAFGIGIGIVALLLTTALLRLIGGRGTSVRRA